MYILYMNSYLDLLRNIIKNFNIDINNEFDDVIIKILSKIFDHYYLNRNDKYIYCIDNLYRKYDISRYNFIKKKYKLGKKSDLIYRFNRYNKRSYIIKLLKHNMYVILDKNESYNSITDKILQNNCIKNYKKYIENIYLEKYLSRLDCKVDKVEVEEDDFQIKIIKKTCRFPPCLK